MSISDELLSYMSQQDLNRLALVGQNSQGKSHALLELSNKSTIKNKCIYVANEVKADENLKTSVGNSDLVTWLNNSINLSAVKECLEKEIEDKGLSDITNSSNLAITFEAVLDSCKNLITVKIETSSNKYQEAGSGERFFGQLLMLEKILESNFANHTLEYLIIDEPEQHLHPSLLIQMGQVLKRISEKNIKVILATHSPAILKYFISDLKETRLMRNCEMVDMISNEICLNVLDEIDIYNKDELKFESFKKIEPYKDKFMDTFIQNSVIDSFFCELLLLGEGQGEKELFDVFFDKFKDSQYVGRISTLITNGKFYMPWLVKIINKIGIKTLTLYDTDIQPEAPNEKDRVHTIINDLIDELSDSTLALSTNLENYFEINCNSRDKSKLVPLLIRSKYLDSDEKLQELLAKLEDKIETMLGD